MFEALFQAYVTSVAELWTTAIRFTLHHFFLILLLLWFFCWRKKRGRWGGCCGPVHCRCTCGGCCRCCSSGWSEDDDGHDHDHGHVHGEDAADAGAAAADAAEPTGDLESD